MELPQSPRLAESLITHRKVLSELSWLSNLLWESLQSKQNTIRIRYRKTNGLDSLYAIFNFYKKNIINTIFFLMKTTILTQVWVYSHHAQPLPGPLLCFSSPLPDFLFVWLDVNSQPRDMR